MEDFTIKTKITKAKYRKYLYGEMYKKPQFLLITAFGFFLLIYALINYFQPINTNNDIPYFDISAGIFMLLAPTILVIIAIKSHYSNPSLQNDIYYTFGDAGVTIKGTTFETKYQWAHILKVKETKYYLLLFCSNKLGNFIDKSQLTTTQMHFIKSRVV